MSAFFFSFAPVSRHRGAGEARFGKGDGICDEGGVRGSPPASEPVDKMAAAYVLRGAIEALTMGRPRMKEAIAVFAALAGLALACLCASFPPASECSAPNQVELLPVLAFLGLYAAAGLYAALGDGRTVRLILVLGTALVMAGYFNVLRQTFQIAVETEISCAAERTAVEPTGAAR